MTTDVTQRNESAERAFDANRVVIEVETRDGVLLVDETTGEILEAPGDAPRDSDGRLDWLMAQHAFSADQQKSWDAAHRAFGRALDFELERRGQKSAAGATWRSRRVNGAVRRTATRARADEAVVLGVMNREQYDAVIERAAKDLDPAEIVRLRDEGVISAALADFLVEVRVGNGYVVTEPAQRAAPVVRRKAVSE